MIATRRPGRHLTLGFRVSVGLASARLGAASGSCARAGRAGPRARRAGARAPRAAGRPRRSPPGRGGRARRPPPGRGGRARRGLAARGGRPRRPAPPARSRVLAAEPAVAASSARPRRGPIGDAAPRRSSDRARARGLMGRSSAQLSIIRGPWPPTCAPPPRSPPTPCSPPTPDSRWRSRSGCSTKPLMANHHHGLWGYSGRTADGRELTIQATGIGGPSAAAVLARARGARRPPRLSGSGAARRSSAVSSPAIRSWSPARVGADGVERGARRRALARRIAALDRERWPRAMPGAAVLRVVEHRSRPRRRPGPERPRELDRGGGRGRRPRDARRCWRSASGWSRRGRGARRRRGAPATRLDEEPLEAQTPRARRAAAPTRSRRSRRRRVAGRDASGSAARRLRAQPSASSSARSSRRSSSASSRPESERSRCSRRSTSEPEARLRAPIAERCADVARSPAPSARARAPIEERVLDQRLGELAHRFLAAGADSAAIVGSHAHRRRSA